MRLQAFWYRCAAGLGWVILQTYLALMIFRLIMVFIVRWLWASKDLAHKWICCGPLQLVCWLILALFVCLGSSLLAQPGDSLQQAKILELKPSVWQFGNVGADSQSNGYYHLQYSPNGRFLVARNRDNLVQVYDVKDRVQLYEIGGHESRILQIDFSLEGSWTF